MMLHGCALSPCIAGLHFATSLACLEVCLPRMEAQQRKPLEVLQPQTLPNWFETLPCPWNTPTKHL